MQRPQLQVLSSLSSDNDTKIADPPSNYTDAFMWVSAFGIATFICTNSKCCDVLGVHFTFCWIYRRMHKLYKVNIDWKFMFKYHFSKTIKLQDLFFKYLFIFWYTDVRVYLFDAIFVNVTERFSKNSTRIFTKFVTSIFGEFCFYSKCTRIGCGRLISIFYDIQWLMMVRTIFQWNLNYFIDIYNTYIFMHKDPITHLNARWLYTLCLWIYEF